MTQSKHIKERINYKKKGLKAPSKPRNYIVVVEKHNNVLAVGITTVVFLALLAIASSIPITWQWFWDNPEFGEWRFTPIPDMDPAIVAVTCWSSACAFATISLVLSLVFSVKLIHTNGNVAARIIVAFLIVFSVLSVLAALGDWIPFILTNGWNHNPDDQSHLIFNNWHWLGFIPLAAFLLAIPCCVLARHGIKPPKNSKVVYTRR